MIHTIWQRRAAALVLVLLSACGGGGSSGDGTSATTAGPTAPPTSAEASRFLTQSTFGPTSATISEVGANGYAAWLEAQFAKPQTQHEPYINTLVPTLAAGQRVPQNWVFETFWQKAATAEDQLRQRVVFALSEIFVISLVDGAVSQFGRGVASYLDTLGRHAFGNFRDLLEAVSLHPMMGLYLSHLRNQKEDPARGRVPDENYAREVMQLFTIGLYELNQDGTLKLAGGQPKETYTNADVTGLARVFTGFSWAGPDKSNNRFFGNAGAQDPDREVQPMQGYPQYHSTLAKSFIGLTIPAQATANPEASLKAALDHLFAQPNVGPFIGKQLIQRLVTSNPSPQYVGRVAAAFADNGQGVRGDMRAVLRAVLLDNEARSAARLSDPQFGKLREPIVRLANWMRAFEAKSATGRFLMGNTDNPATLLAQTPLRSPSVFNFYRPGYAPPNTALSAAGLVSPEFQITTESSVAGWINYLQTVVQSGAGNAPAAGQPRDIQSDYAAEIAIADNADALVSHVDLLLTYGAMSAGTRTRIRDAVNSIAASNATGRLNRVRLAVMMTMASPDYIVQR
jgi:uncharacterized protein (DUF1800 family)